MDGGDENAGGGDGDFDKEEERALEPHKNTNTNTQYKNRWLLKLIGELVVRMTTLTKGRRVRARQREVQHYHRQFHRHSRQLDEHHPQCCRHPDEMISICGCGVGGTQRFRLVRAHPL